MTTSAPPAAVPGIACARCRGSVYRTTGETGPVHKCLGCGREQRISSPTAAREPAPAPAASTTGGAEGDWQRLVRVRIAELVRAVEDTEARKREAERLVAALAAYGAASIPTLPWPTAPAPRSRADVPRTCAVCGFTAAPMHFRFEPDGSRRCRSVAGCQARQAARQKEEETQ